jgi:hypothetical protein
MPRRHLVFLITLVVGACHARAAVTQPNADTVVERARRGLGLVGDAKIAATSVRLDSTTLPFVGAELDGKEAWRVEITEPRWPSLQMPYVHALSVLMTPDAEAVMRVMSPWPENEPPIAPFPPVAVEQDQLTNHGERFTRLPANATGVTLATALAAAAKNGGDLAQARQILAYHVVRTIGGQQERTVWIIQLRGIAPFEAAQPGVPVDARNHLRHVVDAETGEWLGADTIPQPEGR